MINQSTTIHGWNGLAIHEYSLSCSESRPITYSEVSVKFTDYITKSHQLLLQVELFVQSMVVSIQRHDNQMLLLQKTLQYLIHNIFMT